MYLLSQVINYCDSQQGCLTAEEICMNASKLITLLDLAGHQKYIKTTIFGLMGYSPDFAMLVVSASTGIGKPSQNNEIPGDRLMKQLVCDFHRHMCSQPIKCKDFSSL